MPEIFGGAGIAIGYAADYVAARRAAKLDAAVMQTWGPVELNENNDDGQAIEHQLSKQPKLFLMRKLASVALAGAASGLIPPAFLGSLQSYNNQLKPTMVEVVDRSGQTQVDNTANKVNEVNDALVGNASMNVYALLARGGSFSANHLSPAEVAVSNQYNPAGEVSVDQAIPTAIQEAANNAVAVQSNQLGSKKQETSAVLVVTDDNSLGNTTNVIDLARSSNTKIFIANVGQQTNSTAQQLRSIAKTTGGEYWNASVNTAKVAKDIVKTIEPSLQYNRLPYNNHTNVLKVLDIMAWLGFAGYTVNTAGLVYRRKQRIMNNKESI